MSEKKLSAEDRALPPLDEWPDRACKGVDLNIFYPNPSPGGDVRSVSYYEAAAYCRSCVHRIACGQWAVQTNQQHGMWGGLTPQRTRMRHRGR